MSFCLQTSTTVLITHVVMEDRVRMGSTATLVTAWWALLEITVKQVNSNNSRRQSLSVTVHGKTYFNANPSDGRNR